MTRAEAIEILKKLIEAMQGHVTVLPTPERIAAIRLAIASLETDEAYQLMYEGGEIFTKDEVAAILTDLQSEIPELKSYESADGQDLVMLADIGTLFQQKIKGM